MTASRSTAAASRATALVAAALLLSPACSAPLDEARATARKRVLEAHKHHVDMAQDILRTTRLSRAGHRLDYHQPVVQHYDVADDRLTWVSVFVARAHAGGGLTYVDWTVRACLSYSGIHGSRQAISWTNVKCPAGPPNIDETMRIG